MAEGGGDMRFSHARRADHHQIGGAFEPVGIHKRQNLVPGNLRVKFPVKIRQQLDALHAGHFQEIFDAAIFSSLMLLYKKGMKRGLLFLRERLHIGQKPEVPP